MGGEVISSGRGRRGPWSHTRVQTMSGAALAVLVVLASIFLLQAGGAQATPNVFSFDRLRLGGSAGPENYVYTVGNVIFPDAGVDPGTYYRFVVTDSSGGVRNPSFPCTAAAGFPIADNTYTVGQSDPPSAGSGWRYTLNQYGNPSCTGTPAKSTFKNLYVAKATAYADAGLTTEKSSFTAGETAYVAIQGVTPGVNDWSVTWLRPLSTAACANTAGSDRPQGSGSGRLPKGTTNYLQYRPNTINTGNAWNRESNYETRPCVALGSTNEGVWGLSVDLNATNFVSVSAFTVDATAPPSPAIDSGPSGVTSSTSASFGFSDSESGVSFRCQLDGGAVSPCSSPQSYVGLSQGAHSFQVKARDAAGNESAAASRSWTVDTLAPPSPTIDSGPSGATSSTSASFGFSDSESGVSFRCQLDGGGFSDCSSPQGYSGLSQGAHSFQVKARDAAGNESGRPAVPGRSTRWLLRARRSTPARPIRATRRAPASASPTLSPASASAASWMVAASAPAARRRAIAGSARASIASRSRRVTRPVTRAGPRATAGRSTRRPRRARRSTLPRPIRATRPAPASRSPTASPASASVASLTVVASAPAARRRATAGSARVRTASRSRPAMVSATRALPRATAGRSTRWPRRARRSTPPRPTRATRRAPASASPTASPASASAASWMVAASAPAARRRATAGSARVRTASRSRRVTRPVTRAGPPATCLDGRHAGSAEPDDRLRPVRSEQLDERQLRLLRH